MVRQSGEEAVQADRVRRFELLSSVDHRAHLILKKVVKVLCEVITVSSARRSLHLDKGSRRD